MPFLGLHPRHMEIPRLVVESELQLQAYATAEMPGLSCICDLHQSTWQQQSLNPLSEARDWTGNLMVPGSICFCCTTTGNLTLLTCKYHCLRYIFFLSSHMINKTHEDKDSLFTHISSLSIVLSSFQNFFLFSPNFLFYHFLSVWRTSFTYSLMVGLPVIIFFWHEHIFSTLSFPKESFTLYMIWRLQLFSFNCRICNASLWTPVFQMRNPLSFKLVLMYR